MRQTPGVRAWVLSFLLLGLPGVVHGVETLDPLDGQVQDVISIPKDQMVSQIRRQQFAVPVGVFSMQVVRAGKTDPEPLGKLGLVHSQDELRTDANTIAQVEFFEGARMVVGHDTRVSISSRKGTGRNTVTALVLHQGLVRLRSASADNTRSLIVDSTAAQIVEIAGAGFIVRHRPPGPSKVGLTVLTLLTGKVRGEGKAEKKTAELREMGQQAWFGDPEEGERIDPLLKQEDLVNLQQEIPELREGSFDPAPPGPGGPGRFVPGPGPGQPPVIFPPKPPEEPVISR